MPENAKITLVESRLNMGLCNTSKVAYNLAVDLQVSAVIGISLDPAEKLNKQRLIRALLCNLVERIETQLKIDPESAGTLIDSFEVIDITPG